MSAPVHAQTCTCNWCTMIAKSKESTMPERNTTVTLDLKGRDIDEVIDLLNDARRADKPEDVRDFMSFLHYQVSTQCPPVLEIGWHEVKHHHFEAGGGRLLARYWNGAKWATGPDLGSDSWPRDTYIPQRFLAGPEIPDFD